MMDDLATCAYQWAELRRVRRAIVVVDVVESVRLMREDEAGTIRRWRWLVHDICEGVLPARSGRMVKSLGDGLLLEFEDIAHAVAAALEIQALCANESDADKSQARSPSLSLRVGLHAGEVVADELDIYGSSVNLAARLASLGQPGDIVASAEIRDRIADGHDARLVDLGECHLKHWDQPVRAFRVFAPHSNEARSPAPAAGVDHRPAVAVIPFTGAPGRDAADAWGDALADAIIGALSASSALRVISILSTRTLRNSGAPAGELGAALNASYLVTGSYRADGHRLHVEVRARRARDGQVLWSARRVADGMLLLAGEDDAVNWITQQISLEVVRSEVQHARALPLANLESFTLYVAGTYLLHRLSRTDFERSRELLEHLAHRHPRSAAPYAMLSKWHLLAAVQGWTADRRASSALSRAQARRAIDIEPDHALALSMEAIVVAHLDGDLTHAVELGEAAVRANPQESHAWLNLGGIHSYLGHGDAAMAMPRRAIELSPLDPARFVFDAFLAEGCLAAGRYDEAAAAARESIRQNALHASSHRILTISLGLAGRIKEAKDAANELLRVSPEFTVSGYERQYPGRDQVDVGDRLRALREAGLPG